MGNFEPLPWALGRSKKFDLNGNELAITSLLDINNKKYMSKIFFSIISESARLLLLKGFLLFILLVSSYFWGFHWKVLPFQLMDLATLV